MATLFTFKTNISMVTPLKNNYIMILVTCKDKLQAEKITQSLLAQRLIACGNIVSPVTSFFNWLGKIDKAEECLIVMKSRMDLFGQVAEQVKSLHSYEVPEVLALPIVEGSKAYLDWMSVVLKPA
jgi:periplasmic divalent cation tolerance protein